MATIELEPVTPVWEDESDDDQEHEDHRFCHLYVHGQTVALCGLPNSMDWHDGLHPSGAEWRKGMMGCSACGVPICMDCLLAAG